MTYCVRPYAATDAAETLEVFERSVRGLAGDAYSDEQVEAWVGSRTVAVWVAARVGQRISVASAGPHGPLVGLVALDVQDPAAGVDAHLDLMFVVPEASRQGIASALLEWAMGEALACGAARMSTFASRTAVPFFEARGFVVEAERTVWRSGVELQNFAMSRSLAPLLGA
ncbi:MULTISPECIES: GNAT family N-acetyltransferase [unclassified Leucobacter]|uniref:GNAT family N-acetyltransferase n=1 Tax=unclassified Leucobacter TaxID=2621730 RepID=UPI00165E3C6A|nr:GNAT family N-acetyltransferase [Leucobacter sp. CX169]MBC9928601.1 GNAT family N-acetyltransferase [Leucobacter sp. cx-169]